MAHDEAKQPGAGLAPGAGLEPHAQELLKPGRSRETALRRDRFGKWFDGGTPLSHPRIEEAFDGWLEPADGGRFRLRNDVNWAYVRVEGAPRTVKRVNLDTRGARVVLSSGREEPLDMDTVFQDVDGTLYCLAGEPALLARFQRDAMHSLGPYVTEHDGEIALRWGGKRYVIPVRPGPCGEASDDSSSGANT